MDIISASSLSARKSADLLVIPFYKGKQMAEAAADASALKDHFAGPIALKDFVGNEGEVALLYIAEQPEKRFVLLGLGSRELLTVEKLRRAYAHITKACHKKKLKSINILVPDCPSLTPADTVRGLIEGLLLPNYQFTALKKSTLKDHESSLIEKVTLVSVAKAELAAARKYETICESVNFARDLVNGNADDVTPQYLSAVARGLEKTCPHVKTTIFDKKRIEKENLGLLLAVNRGSFRDPAFIIVEYKGNPHSKDRTVLIGKGITYDTGGLLIKPRGGMETMKEDMAGAAAVLGTIQGAAALNLKVNLIGVIPTTENSTGSRSYKPGDVYTGYAGISVEIVDTDAEGRLVLADALAYAVKNFKPTRIIDLATLTGAVEVALGDEASGLLSNDDALADLLIHAGSETGERVWRLPLYEDYKESLKSNIADLKNHGGRTGGCVKAASFLQHFVGDTPWAHLDIAGTACIPDGKRYLPKYATGVGVRLILSVLEHL